MSKLAVVTGGAGFVGSHLCERLAKEGYRVISLDNYFTGSKDNHVAGVEYREGHTKDIATLVPENPDILYHLGEYARVEQSLEEPAVVWDLNVLGTFAVLEYWRDRKCKLVYAGSSTKFGDGGDAQHATPYGWTKAKNTELVQNYGEWFGLSYAITYFYNVYGPRERSGRYGTAIAIFAQQFHNGHPITVTLPGTQMRNFTHVSDIVDGLILVGEKGEGDQYALGNERAYSVLEVARLFSPEVVMLPERRGNRLTSGLETTKSRSLGWSAQVSLEDEILKLTRENPRTARERKDKRVLVFATTFYPVAGPAEHALSELIAAMPDVHFDIITTGVSKNTKDVPYESRNATIYHVGRGISTDKYFLPYLGYKKAQELYAAHKYLFVWSLMASYGALAALLLKRAVGVPVLVTLADQNLDKQPWYVRLILRRILHHADQVYATNGAQENAAHSISKRTRLRSSMGDGDAFANQIRFAYGEVLRSK